MSAQQFLDPGPDDGTIVRIAVDQRESNEFDQLLLALGASVTRTVLDVGDFLCSARLAVERKTRADFEQSVMDGRLFSQLQNLVSNYERIVIIVEGTENEGRLSRNSLLGAYGSIIADFGASLMFTRDMAATAELVFHLAKHEQLSKKQPMRIYAKRKTFTPSQSARAVIESLPGVGPKLAMALLAHFGTIEQVVSASEKDLAAVPGVGKKKAKIIKALLVYEYDNEDDGVQLI